MKAMARVTEPKYHHGDLRRAILEAALELIKESGIQSLSLREIARRIGVTPAAPYHHFKDRGELLVQIGMQGYGHLLKFWSRQRPRLVALRMSAKSSSAHTCISRGSMQRFTP